MFEYYTIGDVEQIRFYQLPKEPVKNEKFRVLSDSAKILYALLRDRVSLSVKNGWVDEYGHVCYILLDVRTEDEYREGRIDGAVLIPDYEIAERAESELPDKDAVILIYCRSGRRSANAAAKLADTGYTNIYDFGGIIDRNYETISG